MVLFIMTMFFSGKKASIPFFWLFVDFFLAVQHINRVLNKINWLWVFHQLKI